MARKAVQKATTKTLVNKKSANKRNERKAQNTKTSPISSPPAGKLNRGNKKGSKKTKKQQAPPPSIPSSSDDEESLATQKEDEGDNVASSRNGKLGENNEQRSHFEGSEKHLEKSDDEEGEDGKKETGFTDDNAKWLKPKRKDATKQQRKSQLLSSDDEDDDDDDDDALVDDEFVVSKDDDDEEEELENKDAEEDSDDDNEEEEEELEVERQSRLLDEELMNQQAEAEQELRRTIAENTEIYHLPTKEEMEKDSADRVVPPSEIRSRVESILEVLADFKNRREEGRSRGEYIEQLISDIAELYGYLPELIEYFHSMFGPSETLEFVDASDKPRPLVIRTNTLKARRKDLAAALMKRGVTLDPLAPWSKVGLKIIESPVPIGATPEYLSGMYMLQSAASMCPVMALSPQLKEKVLDMSAAPGGKTSYIAQLMRNTGVIFANDLKPERQKATVANLHRLGVKNVIACAMDGRKLGTMFHNRFDRILLDAPCSGLGVISRDPSVKIQRTTTDVQRCAHLQKELLLAAIDALNHKSKTGGVLVYSTCSVSVAENEEVVNYALSKRHIKIIETGLDFGKPGFTRYQQKRFHPSVSLTRRFYPHVHNMDGFYVAKIQKLSDKRPDEISEQPTNTKEDEDVESSADAVEKRKEDDEEEEEEDPVREKVPGKRKFASDKEKLVAGPGHKKPRKDTKVHGKQQHEQHEKKAAASKAGELVKDSSWSKKGRVVDDVSGSMKSGNGRNVVTQSKDPAPTKKKKLNAKVTKPRRPKASSDVM